MENNNLLVSVCVPIYGVEMYIEKCVVSLFEQTYPNIEYVFVNDCSLDESMNILAKVCLRYPAKAKQVKIISHEANLGLSGARQTAINNSNGDFISWVDSDDFVEKNMIEKLVMKAIATGADIVSCGVYIHYPSTVVKYRPFNGDASEMILAMLNRKSLRSVWGRLIRRSLYLDNNIFPILGSNNGEDLQVMPRLVYYGCPAVIDDYLYHYNCENTSSYTYKFTRSKADDVWTSLKLLEDFFRPKETVFFKAVLEEEAKTIVRDMVNSCRWDYKDYYSKARNRMADIAIETRQNLPIVFRAIYALKSYYFIRFITRFLDFLSRFCK